MSKSCSGSGMLVYNGRDSKCLVKACWPSAVRCYIYICVYIYLTCFKTSAYLGVILNSKIPYLLALDVFRAQWGDWGLEFKILPRGYFFCLLVLFLFFHSWMYTFCNSFAIALLDYSEEKQSS